jgi:hypothetical protein
MLNRNYTGTEKEELKYGSWWAGFHHHHELCRVRLVRPIYMNRKMVLLSSYHCSYAKSQYHLVGTRMLLWKAISAILFTLYLFNYISNFQSPIWCQDLFAALTWWSPALVSKKSFVLQIPNIIQTFEQALIHVNHEDIRFLWISLSFQYSIFKFSAAADPSVTLTSLWI